MGTLNCGKVFSLTMRNDVAQLSVIKTEAAHFCKKVILISNQTSHVREVMGKVQTMHTINFACTCRAHEFMARDILY